MKRLLTTGTGILMLLLSLSLTAGAQQEQSDYEVYQSFTNAHSQLQGSLDRVGTSAAADSLIGEIRELEDNYAGQRELLDKALHPRSFRGMVNELRSRAVDIRERLTRIESLNSQVEQLNERLASYNTQLQHLNSRADSLQQAMQSTAVEKREMEQLSSQYRQSIERRDALVLAIVDSLASTYSRIGPQQQEQIQSSGGSLSEDRNALMLVERIARENAEFLNNASELEVMDYLRMKKVQVQFTDMWNRLEDELVRIYSEGEETQARINEYVQQWENRLDTQLWLAVNQEIRQREFPLAEVNSNQELFEELNTYVNESLTRAEEQSGEKNREEYQRFNSFWNNQVQLRWAEFSGDAGVLTHRQMVEIDQTVDQWTIRSQPESNLFAWLFGASMFLWLLTGLMLIRRNSNSDDSDSDSGSRSGSGSRFDRKPGPRDRGKGGSSSS